MKVSVIVTTYNKERELSLVLEAYRYQQYQDFEIVVADDGSGPATKEVIEEARGRLKVPVKHSWQEDDGFRAARSRNLAIKQCEGEIIAMTDGDCFCHVLLEKTGCNDRRGPKSELLGFVVGGRSC